MASPGKPAPAAPAQSPAAAPPADLRDPALYINRDLSQLRFNRRVLELAVDDNLPLLERLRFLCISSTNLDEFFEIRVAGLSEMAQAGAPPPGPDGLNPADTLRAIGAEAQALVAEQYRVLNEVLIPALEAQQIRFIRRSQFTPRQEAWVRAYFNDSLLPVLSPLGLDPAHPFPRILNKSLNFIVSLKGRDAFGRVGELAVVQAPRALPRLIRLPPQETGSGANDFVFLSSVIHAYVDELFPGMKVQGCYQFRVTRNSDLYVDTEEADDLLRAVEGELASRRYGDEVRLEAAHDTPEELIEFLLEKCSLTRQDLFLVNGPVNLNRLAAVSDEVDRPELKFAPFTPACLPRLAAGNDLFEAIRERDFLLHHPYESFSPVVELLRQAASDPNVLAIKQTLYRTGSDSPVVEALLKAAQAGKEVTVVIELRARFDEADNIALANRLQEAGAHVVYGVVGYKTHAKLLLIVRREGRELRRYAHLGTGNYHPRTTRFYTDYGLLTASPSIGEEVHQVFMQLTSLGRGAALKKLLQAPFTLHSGLLERIAREEANARAGKPARIMAKMNALTEPQVIQALYAASQAGVKIRLLVRGICALRPGVPGVSDNIRVISVLGRFLEHHRVFYFENAGTPELFLASADWMDRNLLRRVEVAFPVEARKLRERVLRDLQSALKDTAHAWRLLPDGAYQQRLPKPGEPAHSTQLTLLKELAGA